jgi:hypothetical protein
VIPGFNASLRTYLLKIHLKMFSVVQVTQGGSGGKANILGGDSVGHCDKKKLLKNTEVL